LTMPAGSTYSTIATFTATGNIADYTFSSIPSTFTDLVLTCSVTCSSTQTGYVRVNGDTGTNYSWTYFNGNGSTVSGGIQANATLGLQLGLSLVGMSATNPSVFNAFINNYANTNTFKCCVSRANGTGTEVESSVSLWRSTSAITSLTVRPSGGNWQSGSTFTLYGITAA
jgi:hypothetical protein